MSNWTARVNRWSTARAAASENQILRDLLWIVAAGALGIGVVLALLPAAGHDQLWCLYVAGRMLAGVKLYGPEIFESNPPLITWLSELPVALAHALHVEPSFAAKLITLLVLGAFFPFTLRCVLFLFSKAQEAKARRWAGPLLALFFAVAFLCIPARDFGQREHLLSFLVLPYLLLAGTTGTVPDWLRVLAGGVAAAGICLKPQQAILPLCLEALLLLRARSLKPLRRPEPWLIFVFCGVYVALIRVLTPAYFTETLPILRETYWAIGHLTAGNLLLESLQLQVLALACLGMLCSGKVRKSLGDNLFALATVLAAAGVAGDLAYLQQGTGWYYQQLPAIVFFTGCLFIIATRGAAQRLHCWKLLPLARTVAAVFALFAVWLTLHCSGYPLTRDRAYAIESPDPAIFRNLVPNTPVAILTTSVDEAMMPVARYHLFWAQRTNNLWWMPAILRSEAAEDPAVRSLDRSQLAALSALQRRNMAEDLERWHPALVLVERCHDAAVQCQVIEDLHPDLIRWFDQDEGFRKAFRSYRQIASRGRFDVYARTSQHA